MELGGSDEVVMVVGFQNKIPKLFFAGKTDRRRRSRVLSDSLKRGTAEICDGGRSFKMNLGGEGNEAINHGAFTYVRVTSLRELLNPNPDSCRVTAGVPD